MADATFKSGIEKVMDKLSLGGSTPEPSAEVVQALRSKFDAVGQGHLFTFWDDLPSAEKAVFFEQLSKFEPERIAVRIFKPLLVFRLCSVCGEETIGGALSLYRAAG
jgi:hypothetical protein